MKSSWIAALALLLVASVGLVVYPFIQGMMSDTLVLVMASFLIVGSCALIGCIGLLAVPQKKPPETKLQAPAVVPAIEKPKEAEPEPSPAASKVEERPNETPVSEVAVRGSNIIDIEGIGPVYAEKLNAINIFTTTDLLEAGATPSGRKELAEKTAISGTLILRWVNLADLFRVKGVGEEYSDLLEAAGVDTVVELSKRVPENLHAKMIEVNHMKNLVRRAPTLTEVRQWVEEAKTLRRKIQY